MLEWATLGDRSFLLLLRVTRAFELWQGQFGCGDLDQAGEPFVVVPFFFRDQEPGFCAGVWEAFFEGGCECLAGCGGFYKEFVVTDQGDGFAAGVHGVFAEHLSGAYIAGAGDLLEDVINDGLPGGHGLVLILGASAGKRLALPLLTD